MSCSTEINRGAEHFHVLLEEGFPRVTGRSLFSVTELKGKVQAFVRSSGLETVFDCHGTDIDMSSHEWRWGSPSSEAERTYQTWMSVPSKVLWGSIALRGGCGKRELYNACFYRTVTVGSGVEKLGRERHLCGFNSRTLHPRTQRPCFSERWKRAWCSS